VGEPTAYKADATALYSIDPDIVPGKWLIRHLSLLDEVAEPFSTGVSVLD
jgi:hypothetical protein